MRSLYLHLRFLWMQIFAIVSDLKAESQREHGKSGVQLWFLSRQAVALDRNIAQEYHFIRKGTTNMGRRLQ